MRRREFLKLVAASTTGAVLFTGCGIGDGDPETEFQLEMPVLNPQDVVFGRDNWYATMSQTCTCGCGVLVRVYEGRAKKIEGNPEFPTNGNLTLPGSYGATCARAQAAVQEVYHPDRVASPLRATSRGSGTFTQVSWDEAMTELTDALNAARGTAGSILLITEPLVGPQGQVVAQFAETVGARHVAFEPDERVVLREAMRRVFGVETFPTIDLPNTDFLVSFSADFLHTWISPVQFSRGYGEFRQGRPDQRGTYYHVGPHFSGSASNADRWLPIQAGTEGLVALAVAQVLTSSGAVDAGRASQIYSGINLDDYAPDIVAAQTGLTAEQIVDLAQQFGNGSPSVAIAGTAAAAQTNGLFNLTAVFALNLLVGSVGVPGGLQLNPPSPFGDDVPAFGSGTPYRDWADIINDMNSGAIDLVLVDRSNPAYGLPSVSGFQAALGNVGKVVSLVSVPDDTSTYADLVLPVHTGLESWGLMLPDPGPGYQTVGMQQPVVQPFVDSRQLGDVLIAAANAIGSPLPWATTEEAVKAGVEYLNGLNRGNVDAPDAKTFLVTMQTQGGWWDTGNTGPAAPSAPPTPTAPAEPEFAGASDGLLLLPFPSNSLDYGQAAHLPWMQALPDPISSNVWTTWVELNPTTADRFGVTTGDVVRVVSPDSSLKEAELPVYVNPAAMPDVALVPMGQGHTGFTRYAEKRGVNPLELVAPQTDSETGALAWGATRITLETTGKRVRIPRLEGQVPAFPVEGQPIVQVVPPKR